MTSRNRASSPGSRPVRQSSNRCNRTPLSISSRLRSATDKRPKFWETISPCSVILIPPCTVPGGSAVSARATGEPPPRPTVPPRDRKSTRLNSSHVSISYAVFCLKKKMVTLTDGIILYNQRDVHGVVRIGPLTGNKTTVGTIANVDETDGEGGLNSVDSMTDMRSD